MMDIFDDEYIYEIHDYNVRKEAEREAKREAERAVAERVIKLGKMPLEEIADCLTTLSLNELREIEKSVMQPE